MGQFHEIRFPGESEGYRAARDNLLAAECELRTNVEAVAALRRSLPLGGALKEDYSFAESAVDLADRSQIRHTRLSELFEPGKDSLLLYSFMLAPGGKPCPMCTAFLDSLNGNALHIGQRANLSVVAKAPIDEIRDFARDRQWVHLRLLSSGSNSYNADYSAEDGEGEQIPAMNVFRKTGQGIFHSYAAELLYTTMEEGQHFRHMDQLWPLWNALDLTPEGRGADWWPSPSYD